MRAQAGSRELLQQTFVLREAEDLSMRDLIRLGVTATGAGTTHSCACCSTSWCLLNQACSRNGRRYIHKRGAR